MSNPLEQTFAAIAIRATREGDDIERRQQQFLAAYNRETPTPPPDADLLPDGHPLKPAPQSDVDKAFNVGQDFTSAFRGMASSEFQARLDLAVSTGNLVSFLATVGFELGYWSDRDFDYLRAHACCPSPPMMLRILGIIESWGAGINVAAAKAQLKRFK